MATPTYAKRGGVRLCLRPCCLTGTDDLVTDCRLSGNGQPWDLRFDPTEKYIFVVTPRDNVAIPPGEGNTLHTLLVGPDGKISEAASSPVSLPVALDVNPFGVVVVVSRDN